MKKLFLTIIFAVAAVAAGTTNAGTTYPQTGIVIDTNYETDTVTVETFSGLQYRFSGVEDWMYGDICSMIMSESGTPETVLDDRILETRYSGYVENYISAEPESLE